mgnify:CR=1 FL=1
MHTVASHAPIRRALTSAVLTMSAALAGGCAGEDESKTAVRDAGLEFRMLAVGDATLSRELSSEAYESSASLVSPHAGSDAPYAEAASVSLAMARLGQSAIAAQDATDAETQIVHRTRVIRGHLSEWRTLGGVADASESVEIGTDKTRIEDLIEQRRGDVEGYQKNLAQRREEIGVLESRIEDLEARAARQREQAAEIELRMTRVSATEGAELAREVRSHTLRANEHELKAEEIRGRVEQLRPQAQEIRLQVEKAREQIRLLEDSLEGLDTRVQEAQRDARQAREGAQEARKRIVSLVEELRTHRSQTADPTHDAVIEHIRAAISAARGARSNASVSGSLATAQAQQLLGRALTRRARGEDQMAQIFTALIDAGLEGEWTTLQQDHAARRDELMGEARAAFNDAASAMRRVRVRGEAGEALDAAATRLESLGAEPTGTQTPNSGDSGDEGAPPDQGAEGSGG